MKLKNKVHSLTESSAEYRNLSETKDNLIAREAEKRKQRSELASRLSTEKRSPAQIERAQRVAALVGDVSVAERPDGHAELAKLDTEIADIKTALDILDSKLARERVTASKAICDVVRPEYQKIVSRMASALIEVDAAHREYVRFTNELTANNIAWSGFLRPVGLTFIGSPGDQHGRIANWMREAIEYRLISPDVLPKEMRR